MTYTILEKKDAARGNKYYLIAVSETASAVFKAKDNLSEDEITVMVENYLAVQAKEAEDEAKRQKAMEEALLPDEVRNGTSE